MLIFQDMSDEKQKIDTVSSLGLGETVMAHGPTWGVFFASELGNYACWYMMDVIYDTHLPMIILIASYSLKAAFRDSHKLAAWRRWALHNTQVMCFCTRGGYRLPKREKLPPSNSWGMFR